MNCDFETAYSTFILCLILILSGLIIYFLYSKIEYLENNITKQNEVLTDFIENVGKRMMSSCSSCPYLSGGVTLSNNIISKNNNKLETINEDEDNKRIIVSDDDDDDDDSDSSDTDDESSYDSDEFEPETESETDYKADVESNISTSNDNIKRIEIVKNLDGNEDLLHNILDKKTRLEIEEVDNEEGEGEGECEGEDEELEEVEEFVNKVEEKEDLVKKNDTFDNIKKIDLNLNEKTELNDEEKNIVDENVGLDMSKLKKMSVNELRALVVLKGLSNKETSNKMKKNDLLKLFEKQ